MGTGRDKIVEDLGRTRSIERIITIVASLALIAMAVFLLHGESSEGSATLDVNASKGTVSVALERYGPSVALVALAVVLVPFVFLSPLKIKLPNGTTVQYADARHHAGSRSLALSRDEFVELRDAATRARQADPQDEATILLSRISQSVFDRSCITLAQLERRSALITKLESHQLASDERRELVQLQQLLTEKDAAAWMRDPDNSRGQRLANSERAGEAT